MNDNNINNNSDNSNVNTYHATANLNTAIENPEINMWSTTGINIEENNNYLNNNQNTINNQIQNNPNQYDNSLNNNPTPSPITNTTPNFSDYSSEYETNFYNTDENNNYYSYEPILQEKKNNSNVMSEIIHSKEAKLMVLIIFILIVFLLIIPYIYVFFINL